jgi:uncharacterized coiled-coil protein SlyX
MSGVMMEMEDYYHQAMARIGAQEEQIDNLVAMVADRDRKIEELKVHRAKLLESLDDALAIIRQRNARDEAMKAEAEALEL